MPSPPIEGWTARLNRSKQSRRSGVTQPRQGLRWSTASDEHALLDLACIIGPADLDDLAVRTMRLTRRGRDGVSPDPKKHRPQSEGDWSRKSCGDLSYVMPCGPQLSNISTIRIRSRTSFRLW